MARRTKKDQEMAAELKKRKVERTTMLCPICHKEISVKQAYGHISFHKS